MNTDDTPIPPAPTESLPPTPSETRLLVLTHSVETDPSLSLDGPMVESIYQAWKLAWHPWVLCRLTTLPRTQSPVFDPPSPDSKTTYIVPGRLLDQVPSSFIHQAEDVGAAVIVASDDPQSTLLELFRRLRGHDLPDTSETLTELVADFQALGMARLWLVSTTIALGHVDVINHDNLTHETLAAAARWKEGDFGSAKSHLQAAFEVLQLARERFYPVDCFLLDLVMTHKTIDIEQLRVCLASHAPKTLVGSAEVLLQLSSQAPDLIQSIKAGVDNGWLDLAGGPLEERPEHLLPLETVRTLYRKGDLVYRQNLDDRSVETLFHRNFALYPALPHMARRMGFRFGFPAAFDGGKFPLRRESKILWASPDGTTIEALTRIPADADDPLMPLRFPWLLGQSMKDDQVALATWLRWPSAGSDWLQTLITIESYAPVFGRFLTTGDFFAQTDRPFDTMTPDLDSLVDPSLENALAHDEINPVSRLKPELAARGTYDALSWIHALASSLGLSPSPEAAPALLQAESADPSALQQAQALSRDFAEKIAEVVLAGAPAGSPGTLLFNPCAVARRVPVLLDSAAPDLRLCPSIQSAQFVAEGTLAVVDLPANGFAWVPHFANVDDPLTPMGQLKYDFETNQIIHPHFVVSIDMKTGGFKGLKRPGEPQARMGQQLALIGASGADDSTCMIQEGTPDVAYAGPSKLELRTRGRVVDPADESRTLARFEQVYEAWLGRPTLDLRIELSEIDQAFFSATHANQAAPWGRGLVSRWAWRDTNARLRRLAHLQAHPTTADKPTTSEALEIGQGTNRVTIIPHGLPYHRRNGQRMLDSLLIAGQENHRSFQFSLVTDLEFPHQAVIDALTPVISVPVKTGPPPLGHQGWFFHLDHRNVAMTKLEFQPSPQGDSLLFHIQETAGRAARVRLRLMIAPTFARQVDDRGLTILDLTVSDDAVDIDLTPFEIARVQVGI
ncbi:MAG: hypothetical protein WCJ40_18965 [Planctomycetota bacterium]